MEKRVSMLNVYSLRLGADVHKDTPILYVGQDRKYYFLFLRKVRMFIIRAPKDISNANIPRKIIMIS